jgi:2-amino-4-hydroxy-6-hydroxymethyldihydropteridine diphosphokinase
VKNRAYLSLGSNIRKETNLPRAVTLLGQAGILAAVSSAYETLPVGRTDQPPFLNAAVLLLTEFSPEEVKDRLISSVEHRLNRVRDPADPNAPRTIDIDISLWNDEICTVKGQAVPDPDIMLYAHVTVPLAEIAPRLIHPVTGETLAAIAARLVGLGQVVTPRPDVVLRKEG